MRGVPRWFAVLAVVASLAVVCAFTLRRALAPSVLDLRISATTLPADGFTSAELTIRSANHRDLHDLKIASDDPHRVSVESVIVNGDAATATLRAGALPGPANVTISASGVEPRQLALTTMLDPGDSFGDGTPDFLRLHDPVDRENFRRWFALLAEAQYYRGQKLPTEIDDCAALLRFSYRETLRTHDSAWAKTIALPVPPRSGNVSQYEYPYTALGAAMFRVRDGSFAASDLSDGAFAEFADAKTLWRHNTYFLGRDLGRARPGDLLFFRQSGHDMPFHAMIFLGHSQIESGAERYVVYHTGPQGKSRGEIRRLSLQQLMNFPDARWRPVASNSAFLGVYRWNILRGDN